MSYTKKEIEFQLMNTLNEMLRNYNQEDSIISLDYDENNQQCTVKMNVHIVEKDNYIGFGVY